MLANSISLGIKIYMRRERVGSVCTLLSESPRFLYSTQHVQVFLCVFCLTALSLCVWSWTCPYRPSQIYCHKFKCDVLFSGFPLSPLHRENTHREHPPPCEGKIKHDCYLSRTSEFVEKFEKWPQIQWKQALKSAFNGAGFFFSLSWAL